MNKKALPRPKSSNAQVKAYVSAAQKGLKAQHVVHSGGRWAVRRAGATKASRTFDTQKEAAQYAQQVAKNNKTELFIHGRNGLIRERNSFGADSHPPKG
ncbi:DUF2188 domain-containing protein [Candidatus Saccharibacteria bacterium]|nr:DUF2188 domain-containing protein [Candidatus Saccharibacteria bacterium]